MQCSHQSLGEFKDFWAKFSYVKHWVATATRKDTRGQSTVQIYANKCWTASKKEQKNWKFCDISFLKLTTGSVTSWKLARLQLKKILATPLHVSLTKITLKLIYFLWYLNNNIVKTNFEYLISLRVIPQIHIVFLCGIPFEHVKSCS